MKVRFSPLYICSIGIIFGNHIIIVLTSFLNVLGLSKASGVYEYVYAIILFALLTVDLIQNGINLRQVYRVVFIIAFFLFYLFYGITISASSFEYDQTGFSVFNYCFTFPIAIIVFNRLKETDDFFNTLTAWNRVLCLIPIVFIFNTSGTYSMSNGYNLVLCAVIFMLENNKSIYDKVMLCILGAGVVFFSSRGALLVGLLCLAVIVYKRYIDKLDVKRRIIFIALLLVLMTIIYYIYPFVIGVVVTFLGQVNLHSRTLESILNNTLIDDNGRMILQQAVIDKFPQMPFLGYGLLGDRQFLSGNYCHSIYIEVLADFGFLFGSLLLIIVLYRVLKTIICSTRNNAVLIILATFVIVKLSFSGTFTNELLFFALIGCCMNQTERKQT